MRNKHAETEKLFQPSPAERTEFGSGYYRRNDGGIVDDEGKTYVVDGTGNLCDESGRVVKEKPSEGLKMARKQHPDWSDRELSPLAAVYNREIKIRKEVMGSEYLTMAERMLPESASKIEAMKLAYRLKKEGENNKKKGRK